MNTDRITPRQIEILQFVADGHCRKQAREILGVSPHTIKVHLNRIYERLGVREDAHAVAVGFRNGWLR